MTTAEALDSIPEIVARAIPLLIPSQIKCAAAKEVWLENAKWRRGELERKVRTLIIEHNPVGVGINIDLDDIIKRMPNELH